MYKRLNAVQIVKQGVDECTNPKKTKKQGLGKRLKHKKQKVGVWEFVYALKHGHMFVTQNIFCCKLLYC